tara:strand:+ start:265 stop:489 length:225 start_codon:yes stop_codon:yes gene_type:complete
MPTVAKNIVHRPEKLFHPYQVLINAKKKGHYFSRVYSTLEEAIKGRDDYLASLENKLAGGLGEDGGGVVDIGKV